MKRKNLNRGASNVEYAMLAGLVSVVAIVAVIGFGAEIERLFKEPVTAFYIDDDEDRDVAVVTPKDEPVAEPVDPYDGYFDEMTFLLGTPEGDVLELAKGGPWAGVFGDDSDDFLDGTSRGEIFIGAKGNDSITSRAGDDVIVYARGDGQDAIYAENSGYDRLIFPDIASTEAEFLANHPSSSGFRINVPEGRIDNSMHYYSTAYLIEEIEFADGVVYSPKMAADKAAHDAKKYLRIKPTILNEDIVHSDRNDGSYTIQNNPSSANTMTFAETGYGDATFKATGDGRHLKTTTATGDVVTMEYYLSDSTVLNYTRWATLNFADQSRPDLPAFLRRVAEDAKSTGEVEFTAFNDSMRHWASRDKGYTIKGQSKGQDELHFMETSFEDAVFDIYWSSNLYIKDENKNQIKIDNFFHTSPSVGNWIETITFDDGAQRPNFDQIKDRAIHDQKATGTVDLTGYDDYLRYYTSSDKSIDVKVWGGGGIDTLDFIETAHQEVYFTKYWSDLRIHLPTNHVVTVDNYLSGSTAAAEKSMEKIIFKGEEVSRAYILGRVGDGPYVDPNAAPMRLRYDLAELNDGIELPMVAEGVNVRIDWGDATANQSCLRRVTTPQRVSCNVGPRGMRTVTVQGDIYKWSGVNYNGDDVYQNPTPGQPMPDYWPEVTRHLVAVDAWGDTKITNLVEGFRDAGKLVSVPATLPDGVTNLGQMFLGATIFNGDLSKWDVSKVTNMGGMFWSAEAFNNASISDWDVSNVRSMNTMFTRALSFNQDLRWNTGNVENMETMFGWAKSFNKDLSGWCVSKIGSEPEDFDYETDLWTAPQPAWGTCPAR